MKLKIYELDFIKFKRYHEESEKASHRLGESVQKLISSSSKVLHAEERNSTNQYKEGKQPNF